MQRLRVPVLAALAALTMLLAACGGGANADKADGGSGQPSVAHIVSGPLGDQAFYDSAERGIQALAGKGFDTKTLQADGNNPSQWKANLESVSTGEWDIVVTGSSLMVDILTEAAAKYPDQKYVYYDSVVEAPNVASITYKQNEGSFLAGALAALVTTNKDKFSKATGSGKVGLVGGMDIPVINDFVAGYKAGVAAVDPDVEVLVSYIGNFSDSQKGYDQAKAMYDQGADVVFQVASAAGVGVLKAAADAGRYAIGVDQNQNAMQPGYILASMEKDVGGSIEATVRAATSGELAFGETTSYGLANDGVRLNFENNSDLVPQDILSQLEELKQRVIDGEIEVPSVTG